MDRRADKRAIEELNEAFCHHLDRGDVEGFVALNNLPAPPGFDLDPPGTYLFDGMRSTQGFELNRFALSLKQPANRRRFLEDEPAYLSAYELTPECRELIRNRDWTGLLQAGGHLQALLKLAATVGQSLYHIGAHNCGIGVEEMRAACPRRVSGIGSLDSAEE